MIPRTHPYFHLRDLADVLPPGDRAKLTAECEERIRAVTGMRYVLFFPFARTAIRTALEASDIQEKLVAVPGFTCKAVPEAVKFSGNIPVCCDVKSSDWTIDIKLCATYDFELGAVIPTLTYGAPLKDAETYSNLSSEGVLVIEDASMAFGTSDLLSAKLDNSCAVFSLNIGKTLSSVEGGLLVTNDTRLYQRIKAYMAQRFTTRSTGYKLLLAVKFLTVLALYNDAMYGLARQLKKIPFLDKHVAYDTQGELSNAPMIQAHMTTFQLQLLLSQLSKNVSEAQARQRAYSQLKTALKSVGGIAVPSHLEAHNPANFPILLAPEDKAAFKAALLQEGVETYPAWDYSLSSLPGMCSASSPDCPTSEKLAQSVVCLPFYAHLGERQIRRIADGCAQAVKALA